jgi:NADH:ubiquinone oxidoreductase subunit 5 (subunit L)/multisubunit Na+/H+ antiporter MnhA subunit
VVIGPLVLAILFWVVYFSVVFFICHWLYRRFSGPEPKPHDPPVIILNKSMPAREIWERRAKRLQRLFIIVAVILMVLPLFLPFVLPRF